jgi:steroid delta-isomerase-like uncharacterized protein
MTRSEIEAFFRRRERLWFDHDAAGLAADHGDGSVVESPTHGKLTTREAIRGIYETWFAAFPDLKFRHNDILVDGDRAAVFFSTSGTHKKTFVGAAPTGRNMEIHGVALFTLKDGKIVHEKRLYDSTSLLVQIGVIKAKPV